MKKRRIGTPESTKARKPSKLVQMIRSTRGSHPFTHLPAHWKPRLLKRSWLARGRKAPKVFRPKDAAESAELAYFSYASVRYITVAM